MEEEILTQEAEKELPEKEEPEEQGPIPYYRPSIKRLRFILMFFMCIYLFGFPTSIGNLIKSFCGFVPPAFYILSGYLVLREDADRSRRIARTIKRSAITFGILSVVYFGLSFGYYWMQGINVLPVFAMKRFWFNFLVLNVWQFEIGSAIWYVQALLYAYIILYFLEKWKLLKYDWLIAALLLTFTVVTGELAGVIRWEFLGYNYIPGNFLTRALPYILLGSFIHRNMDRLGKVRRLWYWLAIVGGVALMLAEIIVLGYLGKPGYYGHLVGMGVVAAAVCILAFQDTIPAPGFEVALGMSRRHMNWIYYLCQPVSILVALALAVMETEAVTKGVGYIGIITFVICACIAWVIAFIGRILPFGRKQGR